MKLNCKDYVEGLRLGYDLTEPRNLVVIQVGDNEASNLYIKSKIEEAKKWNINILLYKYKDISQEKLIQTIRFLGYQKLVHGMIVQLPLPDYLNEQEILNAIPTDKNVDGFEQDGKIQKFIACTPKGIMSALGSVEGKLVTLIGRGKTVGKPLRQLLEVQGATVIQCHSKTPKTVLEEVLPISDIVISAVGKPNLFTVDSIKAYGVVIDCGISRIDGKQVGDFSHEGLDERNDVLYTPWTGGVGKLTVGALMMNVRETKCD